MAKKRKGRKPKTKKQKDAEIAEKLERILRIASVYHNVLRNKHTRHISKLRVHKFEREFKRSKDEGEKKTLHMLLEDYYNTINKMESFIKEDLAFINKEVNEFKLKPKVKEKIE